jgi:hypothetical protein
VIVTAISRIWPRSVCPPGVHVDVVAEFRLAVRDAVVACLSGEPQLHGPGDWPSASGRDRRRLPRGEPLGRGLPGDGKLFRCLFHR